MRWLGNRFETGARPSVSRGMSLLARLIGTPMTAFGALLLISALLGAIQEPNGEPSPWWGYVIVFLMGLPPLFFGLFMVLGRHGVIIDRATGRIESWSGVIVPMWRKSFKIGKPRKVSVGIHHTSSGHGTNQRTGQVFGVRLTGSGSILLDTFTNALAARRFAERSARTLALPMQNTLVEPTEVRAPDELDMSLAERLQANGAPQEPALGPETRLRVEPGNNAMHLLLQTPRLQLGWQGAVGIAVVGGILAWYLVPVLADREAPWFLHAASIALILGLPTMVYGEFLVRAEVVVSREGLRSTKRVGPFSWSRTLQLPAIEELYFDGSEVQVVTDHAAVSLAAAHSEADAQALEALLRAWVVRYSSGPADSVE